MNQNSLSSELTSNIWKHTIPKVGFENSGGFSEESSGVRYSTSILRNASNLVALLPETLQLLITKTLKQPGTWVPWLLFPYAHTSPQGSHLQTPGLITGSVECPAVLLCWREESRAGLELTGSPSWGGVWVLVLQRCITTPSPTWSLRPVFEASGTQIVGSLSIRITRRASDQHFYPGTDFLVMLFDEPWEHSWRICSAG